MIANFDIRCRVCNERITLADIIQWDHHWEHADGGEHTPENIRPLHYDPCHKRKTATSEAQRSRIDRLEKELHGQPKRKRKSRKIQSRGFDKKPRPLRKPSREHT